MRRGTAVVSSDPRAIDLFGKSPDDAGEKSIHIDGRFGRASFPGQKFGISFQSLSELSDDRRLLLV